MGLLTVNKLKEYLNSKNFDDDVILTIFNVNDGTRSDILEDAIDESWLEENLFLDINVEGL